MAVASVSNGWHSVSSTNPQGPTARMRPPMFGSIPDRCSRISSLMIRSFLTGRAVVGRALPLRELPHGRATFSAGLFGALVNEQLLLEIARDTVGADVVSQSRATNSDRHGKHRAHRPRQSRNLSP